MLIREVLANSRLPKLDSELLLAHVLKKDRTWVLANDATPLTPVELSHAEELFERRRKGEPVNYITGQKEFYGRSFFVTPDTLIPRPATEALIDAAKNAMQNTAGDSVTEIDSDIVCVSRIKQTLPKNITLIDVGTGSGCIAVTLALELPHAHIIAVDISKKALSIAEKNAKHHHVSDRIKFVQGDGAAFVETFPTPFLLVSNPPYIPSGTKLPSDVEKFEPHEALFAGSDGLNVIRPLIAAAKKNKNCCGWIIECRKDQIKAIH